MHCSEVLAIHGLVKFLELPRRDLDIGKGALSRRGLPGSELKLVDDTLDVGAVVGNAHTEDSVAIIGEFRVNSHGRGWRQQRGQDSKSLHDADSDFFFLRSRSSKA